jgi:integrase
MQTALNIYTQQDQWKLNCKNPWTGKKRIFSFKNQIEAQNFLISQNAIHEREKLLLKRKRKSNSQAKETITVEELLSKYFTLSQSSQLTIKQSKYHVAHVISAFGVRQAALLMPHDILNFSEAQRLRGIMQSTVNRRVGILRAALNWAVDYGVLKENPIRNLKLPPAKIRRISPPTPQESNAILACAMPHVQRIIILGLSLGARIGPSELYSLTWRDVDFDNAMLRMPNAQKNRKMNDARDIPIRSTLLPLMLKWYEHDKAHEILYVISWRGKPIKNIVIAWHKALKQAGIVRRIRPYDLRHAYATYSLAGGADIGCVANIMGHTDPSMILKTYQHVQDTHKRAAIEALPDILQLDKRLIENTGVEIET